MNGARPIDPVWGDRRVAGCTFGGSMLGGLSRTTLSRRRAVQALVALAASAVVPLGSIVNAQSEGEGQPTSPPPSNSSNRNNRGNNRFSPSTPPANTPPSPVITSPFTTGPAPAGSTNPPATTAAPASSAPPAAPSPADVWVQSVRETELWSGPD